ncbi:MAG: hypothetical protein HY706_03215 [Candidatus Hydrogenedentes bacterium]|nr:hypothetical protein [Candidatus Hydrogenedentota bacterium]
MFWKITSETDASESVAEGQPDGRFVIQRHHDAAGPHLDIRLERAGYLQGWRVDASSLENGPWATEKAPHGLHWLDQDGDAVREDSGVYTWLEKSPTRFVVLLRGRAGARRLCVERVEGLPIQRIREIRDTLKELKASAEDAARLIADGVTARRRSIERLCGLGRELDGMTFDEATWRKALNSLSLEEIHVQLRAFEVRFDGKYPPSPQSRPEPLPDTAHDGRAADAFAILREK